MFPLFYGSLFALSLIFAAVYLGLWHKHFEIDIAMIFVLVPVACLGYLLSALATSLDGAVMAQKIIYIGGSFLQFFIVLSIINLCQIRLPRKWRVTAFAFCAVIYASVLTIGYSGLFYRQVSFEMQDGIPVLIREYGVMHTVFYGLVGFFLLSGFAAIGYSWIRKKDVPGRILLLLVIPEVLCVLAYFVLLKVFGSGVDLVPLGYVIAELIYLLIAYRMNLYDVSDTVIDSYVHEQKVGYISFDFGYRYLGSNSVAKRIVPGLAEVPVDRFLGSTPALQKIRHYLDSFRKNTAENVFVHPVRDGSGNPDNNRIYSAHVNYLYDGSHRRGYIITFVDDTVNRRYIELVDNYNEQLEADVEEKTRHISEMHDNLIMSLAMMVESRDNSTGGHIQRTRDGVKILIDEILAEYQARQIEPVSKGFYRNIVKAAPMHDLGKIAVDDAVLRKPGRFTPEEFEKMKRHAAEGARVIHRILLNTEDEAFKKIAENVAHYHHERWDGSGYPEGLRGEEIPVEARIMAIADVYDALVSKRVYKEAYDFQRADQIIMDGMGTQFDPGLKDYYVKARPRLEAYYSSLSEE